MRRSAIQPNRRFGTRRNCNGGFRDISGQVDELTRHLGDWPDWNKQIGKDSGWWVRGVEGEVARIIVLNFDKVVTQTEAETISLNFEEAFEGRLDRTGDGWTIKPDDFNARPPEVVEFEVRTANQTTVFVPAGEGALAPHGTRRLVPQP